ncbi:glycoside hydrolase family 47 protein [Conidiobolus coronatus NRRL 28638]|uniref:alpha-1,2-Mannosidase n=1 Tax=Conidiobolus coronatus (strain ATCC 28846 / CBS 209.66 / NRRL 28638) TaxID=796925 RepID=A0A137NZ28_CONC2|nr:glycoside hydrolase family 47 protein [Conidiobolus coronatus NRRL 28638]|eukprot:KXN68007.1 glycoside hydrolase family 47 protein [Conidiobolus coronatus NRRL 28638]
MIVIKIYILFLSTWTNLVLSMSEERRLLLRDEAKEMFYHSYNSYLKYGYPADEVSPRTCKPLKRLKENLANVGVNDVRGNYALTLVDSLDTLAVMGDRDGFEKAVKLVIKDVNFNVNNKVQVFEVTIRMLGGLLSAHLLATDPKLGFQLPWYKGELLHLAQDLGDRLIPAFEQSPTGIPFARVNLKSGVPKMETSETCLAGVGTLMLEFGTLSRLTNKPIYEELAKKALMKVWSMQFNNGLFGCTIDLKKGTWIDSMTGIGAGLDSFFEYLLKTAILFDDNQYMDMFYQSYSALYNQIRDKSGHLYLNVESKRVTLHNSWIDSLSAFLPGMQVLAGDLDGAIKTHLIYYNIWQKYGAMPERYDLSNGHAPILYYPLRPELFESNYYLYQATRDPFYLEVGEMMLADLQNNTRLPCGYGSVKNVLDMTVDDRMESFFLSETLKYLYLLFDTGISDYCNSNSKFTYSL